MEYSEAYALYRDDVVRASLLDLCQALIIMRRRKYPPKPAVTPRARSTILKVRR